MKPMQWLAGAVGLLLLAGCVQRGPGEASVAPVSSANVESADGTAINKEDPANATRQYTIALEGNTQLCFDQNGNVLPPEQQFIVLYDRITNQPKCKKRTLTEDSGEENEYGQPVLRRTTALYDMSGKLLHDFAPVNYDEAVGDLLIRHDPRGFMVDASMLPENYRSELWNYKTGETLLQEVAGVKPLDAQGTRLLATDAYGYLLGVVDREGKVISGFPPPEGYYYASVCNGMIIANNQPYEAAPDGEYRDTLLTPELTPVFSAPSINGLYGMRGGEYLMLRKGEQNSVVDMQGKELYLAPEGETIDYFDNELALLRIWNPEIGSGSSRLVKTDGTELTTGYRWVETIDLFDEKAPAQRFIARKEATPDLLELIDREGKVLATQEIPGYSSCYGIGEGLIVAHTEKNGVTLLDQDFKIVIAPGKYSWIRRLENYTGEQKESYNLLTAGYYQGGEPGLGIMRTDVLDADFRPVVQGLSALTDVGPDRLAVIRGFSAGLMDWKGNWIVKQSIFQGMDDAKIEGEF